MTVVGTRPEFIQTKPVSAEIRRRGHTEILVHTGQHYDANMSDVFFDELDLPTPDRHLGVGSGPHGAQTGQLLERLEAAMLDDQPDWVLIYGDTNSTVAAALAAAKLHLPLAHIEAGLRSYDRRMPEEINRVVTDHVSDLLFAPTQRAVANLAREGLTQGVYRVGDVRVDLLRELLARARERQAHLLGRLGLGVHDRVALATVHRAANTDDPVKLGHIVTALSEADLPIILPAHPRLRKMLTQFNLTFGANVRLINPLGYLDMIAALDACALVITDSGGLQKEAYLLHTPTVTVRDSTEWVETVEAGWNRLVDTEPPLLVGAIHAATDPPPTEHPDFYGSPGVSARIGQILEERTGL